MSRATSPRAQPLGLRENAPQVALLVLVNACVGGMVGLERTVVPLVAADEFRLTSDTVIFSFILAFGLVKAVSNIAAGMLADRFTRKAMLVGGWLIGLPVPFILAWGPSWRWFIVANVLLGANQGFTWSMTVTMKNDLIGARQRGLAMGLNEFAGYGGLGVTALLTGYIAAHTGLRPEPFYLGIVYAIVGLALSAVAVRDTSAARYAAPAFAAAAPADLARPPVSATRTMVAVCQAGLVNNLNDGISWGVLPLLFAARGLGIDGIGVIKAAYPLTWSVAQLGTGALADRVGRRPLITWGMVLQALALCLMGFDQSSPFASGVIGSVLLGVGTAMVYPALLAAAADSAPPATRATTLGRYRFWRDLGYPIGALLAGAVGNAAGLVWAVYLAAGLTFASGIVTAAAMAARHVHADRGSRQRSCA